MQDSVAIKMILPCMTLVSYSDLPWKWQCPIMTVREVCYLNCFHKNVFLTNGEASLLNSSERVIGLLGCLIIINVSAYICNLYIHLLPPWYIQRDKVGKSVPYKQNGWVLTW